jgi:hypothetical protein
MLETAFEHGGESPRAYSPGLQGAYRVYKRHGIIPYAKGEKPEDI